MAWQDGKLTLATIKNISGDGRVKVRYGGKVVELTLKRGGVKTFDANFPPDRHRFERRGSSVV